MSDFFIRLFGYTIPASIILALILLLLSRQIGSAVFAAVVLFGGLAVVNAVFGFLLNSFGLNASDRETFKVFYACVLGAGQIFVLIFVAMLPRDVRNHWLNTHCPKCGGSRTRDSVTASAPYETTEQRTEVVRHYDDDRNEIGRSEYTRDVPTVGYDYTRWVECARCGHSWSKRDVNNGVI